jgi:hypothetical protein
MIVFSRGGAGVQISSSYSNQSIVSLMRETALGSASDGKKKASPQDIADTPSVPVTYGQAYTSLQQTLAASSLKADSSSDDSTDGTPAIAWATTADGKYKVSADPGGQVTNVLQYLNASDIDAIAKASGATFSDGEFHGGDDESLQNLQTAFLQLRTVGAGGIGDAVGGITGDITASQFHELIAKHTGEFTSDGIDNMLQLLDANSSAAST